MRTIVIASPKGGTGKSTLTGHLAVEAEKQGNGPVAVIDTDLQGTLSDWWNARQALTPLFAAMDIPQPPSRLYAAADIPQLPARLETLRQHGVEVVLIDTPPAFTQTTHAALAVADLVVVPVRPSPHDLRAVGVIIEAVEQQGKPFVFVVNAAIPRTHIALDAVRALAQHGKVAPAILHNRIDFATSMVDGKTAGELNAKSRSACEITELWDYVNRQLNRSVRR